MSAFQPVAADLQGRRWAVMDRAPKPFGQMEARGAPALHSAVECSFRPLTRGGDPTVTCTRPAVQVRTLERRIIAHVRSHERFRWLSHSHGPLSRRATRSSSDGAMTPPTAACVSNR
jgi:hypothetical protein